MQRQYNLIDECLHVLRQCDIPAVPKLRLEVQLFQLKLLLLRNDVGRDLRRKFCTEGLLQRIQKQLSGINGSEARDVLIEIIGRDLQEMGFDLAEAIRSVTARRTGAR